MVVVVVVDDDADERSVQAVSPPLPSSLAPLMMALDEGGEVEDAFEIIMVAAAGRRELAAFVVAESAIFSSPILPLQRSFFFVVAVAMIGLGFVLEQKVQ